MGLFDDLIPGESQTSLSARDKDLITRTVLGEAANEPDQGQIAVAAVIRNRLNSGRFGENVPQVLFTRNQFEPWNTEAGRSRMLGYDPNSTAYQRAAAAVDRAFGGNDPTEGATHFYSPVSQQALGRLPPPWARGEPIVIGGHNFYAPEGRVAAAQSASQPASQPTPQAVSTAGMFDDLIPSQTAFSQRFQGEGEPPPNQALATALETKAAS